ncbi:MAG TPA: POTRA domain-containing protein, partial [Opitutaceae bacterium]
MDTLFAADRREDCGSTLPIRSNRLCRASALVAVSFSMLAFNAQSARAESATGDPITRPARKAMSSGQVSEEATFFIREYRVKGAKHLPKIDVESAVYPYLGPYQTRKNVEQARAALEKAYHDVGYQTVAVTIPEQAVGGGIIHLQVIEAPVARLRVKGAKYFSPADIKKHAPSLAEGTVIDFNKVPQDIVALNQDPDRQVTPELHAGTEPGTVDVDLNVKDHSPLHASLEVNNRASPNTQSLRVNGSISDNNLAQSGDSAGFSFQLSPQDFSQVKVFSGYYLKRFSALPNFSVIAQGTILDSNVSTLGDVAVAGRGETYGLRGVFNLPSAQDFVQSLSLGIDYKHFRDTVRLGSSSSTSTTGSSTNNGNVIVTPKKYFPLSASYSATHLKKGATTELNASVNLHLRGMGSSAIEFDNSRYNADGGFIYFHGDLSHTHDLLWGLQAYAKVQGQISNEPLLSQEQFTG